MAALSIAHEASTVAPMLTVSIGAATLHEDSGEQQAELFEAADAQLYRAKQAGRNRIAWR